MLLSDIIGKEIVSIPAAKSLGRVTGVYIAPGAYEAAGICSDKDMHMLGMSAIYASKDILTTEHMSLDSAEGMLPICIGAKVYGAAGKYLGEVTDVYITSKRRLIKTDSGNISLSRVASASAEYVILSPSVRKKTALLPSPAAETEIIEPVKENTALDNDYGFLVGKRITREVSDIGRSFVLVAGTMITDRIVKNALKAGKIADLVATSV